ncbi:BirA family biotin operon repressor/biotin-[acetyl-CoA-carboxylase] ligase [Lactobacillus colini]|uniref:biotin--[biotin carboxyl-carrier protein] ligase n=1 Tax=Lactobacillus colini TaxID=1819254 RepID=A0ABS4MD72_9LACO|nr:biotin--[acetyl-CoA-carboxylase] ligase [Lactobacillus colini]MBP2057635.1 BirA family biotin operon repressor/biotin-[acetyl-CoA-carboxylase] ligase [Lactobacillus colini]
MRIFNYDQVTSTQDLAKKYLEHANQVAVFIANEQTAGYGKRGRDFYSPADSGLYYSLAIPNFQVDNDKIGLLTLNLATKIVKQLQEYFPKVNFSLKWVNDIYVNNKKVAGILAEGHNNGLVIGVGININTSNFPDELSTMVGSISEEKIDKQALIKLLITTTYAASQNYTHLNLTEYKSLSNVINKQITLKIGKQKLVGKAVDIDKLGRLVVEVNGELRKFSSGEITKLIL